MTINRRVTPIRPMRRWLAAAALGITTVLAGACGGYSRSSAVQSPSVAPTRDNCTGRIELLVQNNTPLTVRVLELSEIGVTRLLGEMAGRGTRTFEIRDHAGMIYSVVAEETGELLASEAAHPRGETSSGAKISRACVVEPE